MAGLEVSEASITQPLPHSLWYAVHTRSRHEKKVVQELDMKQIETFLPLVTEMRKWSDRRTQVQVPLFSCYVFVRIPQSPEARVEVLRSSGVLAFVGGNQLCAAISEHEIENIQMLLAQKVPFAPHSYLKIGQRVRVRGGALEGMEGILTRINGNDRLVISVDTIQRSLSVTLEGIDVEPMEARRN